MTYNINLDFLFYHLFSYGTDTSNMKLDDVSCSHNNYLTILQCSYSTYIDSGCINTNSYDATVQCCELHMLMIFGKSYNDYFHRHNKNLG